MPANPTMAEPLSESSMGVQIAAASVQAQNNLKTAERLNLRQISNRLTDFILFIEGSGPGLHPVLG